MGSNSTGKGKRKTNYLRITNLIGKEVKTFPDELKNEFKEMVKKYFKIKTKKIEIQKIPNLLVYILNKNSYNYSLANFDDGLVYVGTNYCFNHDKPECEECPLKKFCVGYKNKNLISNYTT